MLRTSFIVPEDEWEDGLSSELGSEFWSGSGKSDNSLEELNGQWQLWRARYSYEIR